MVSGAARVGSGRVSARWEGLPAAPGGEGLTQAMATALLALTVAVALDLIFFSIERLGTDNVIIYATFLALPPVACWLVWAARGRGAPLQLMLLVGICVGFISMGVWRLRRWDKGPQVKHYRYQVPAITVVAPASAVVGGLAIGLSSTVIVVLALAGAVGAYLLSLFAWRWFQDRWRAQGWKW